MPATTTRPSGRPFDDDSIFCPKGHYIGQAGAEFTPGQPLCSCGSAQTSDAAGAEARHNYHAARWLFENGATQAEVDDLLSRLD